MRNDAASTSATPKSEKAISAARQAGPGAAASTAGIGRHAAAMSRSKREETSTNVLRWAASGTRRAKARLNPARAITLCCTPKSATRPTSRAAAASGGVSGPTSIERGRPRFSMKPMKTANAPRKIAYADNPYAASNPRFMSSPLRFVQVGISFYDQSKNIEGENPHAPHSKRRISVLARCPRRLRRQQRQRGPFQVLQLRHVAGAQHVGAVRGVVGADQPLADGLIQQRARRHQGSGD